MNCNHIKTICFSPTQSTKRILETIVSGITSNSTDILDITLSSSKVDSTIEVCADLVLIGVPVYGGRVPADALSRLQLLYTTRFIAIYKKSAIWRFSYKLALIIT
jgi:hypothetical protein